MDYEYQKRIQELYDSIAEEFDKTRISPDPFLEKLIARGFAKYSKIMLDNGCGNCRNLKLFNRNAVLIAGDISKNMLRRCRNNVAVLNVHYVQYALTNLPFRNGVFNGVFCIAAVHHLKRNDVLKAIREMKNVLSNEGWLLISSWSTKILRAKKFLRKVERTDEGYFLIKWGKYKRFYFLINAKTLRELCERVGLSPTALEYGMNSYVLMDGRKLPSIPMNATR
jgi:ubiquinone/menaquinone biosynthesis C-methylase UbiE